MTASPPRPAARPDASCTAPAKVNLFLEVLSRRDDGYHEIETVMQAVDLCDRLEFTRCPRDQFTISVEGGQAPADESNLALRAARLLASHGAAREGVHIDLRKRIPSGGGLGGGSSDAAATLRALNSLWELNASLEDLCALGAQLGSDVNFFLYGGTALCSGRGEVVHPLQVYNPTKYLLFVPQLHVSTRDIYARLRMPLTTPTKRSTNIIEAMTREDWPAVGREIFNRLEEPAYAAYPQLAAVRQALVSEDSWGPMLSGSGCALFLMAMPENADGLAVRLEDRVSSGVFLTASPLRAGG